MNKTYIPAVFVLAFLAISHYFGSKYYLYLKISWYDIVMHMIGGMGMALAFYWFVSTFFKNVDIDRHLWIIILVGFVGGLSWEAFESYFNIAGAPVGTLRYYIDTTKDLINDILGSIIIYFSLKK